MTASLLICISSGFQLSAQQSVAVAPLEEICGTPDISAEEYEALPWYGDESDYPFLDRYYDSLASIYDAGTNLRVASSAEMDGVEEPWLRIPVKFWVYQKNDGTPGGVSDLLTERGLQRGLDDL